MQKKFKNKENCIWVKSDLSLLKISYAKFDLSEVEQLKILTTKKQTILLNIMAKLYNKLQNEFMRVRIIGI